MLPVLDEAEIDYKDDLKGAQLIIKKILAPSLHVAADHLSPSNIRRNIMSAA